MGTPLQEVYDLFQARLVNEVLTGKESLIFVIFKIALSKANGTVNHALTYVLDDPIDGEIQYSGYFVDVLDVGEMNLIALYMVHEWNQRQLQLLRRQERDVGTADFNRIPGKKEQLEVVKETIKVIKDDISELKQEFNTYKN